MYLAGLVFLYWFVFFPHHSLNHLFYPFCFWSNKQCKPVLPADDDDLLYLFQSCENVFSAWNSLISKIPDLVRFDQTHIISTCLVHLHFCHVLALSRCARYPLALRGNTRNFPNEHGGPLASMTNARRPYVKLHVCLILNQTHKEKGLGLVKTSGSLGTPGFAPNAPLWLWKSLQAACVSKFANIYCKLLFLLLKSWLTHRDACKIVNTSHLPARPLSSSLG